MTNQPRESVLGTCEGRHLPHKKIAKCKGWRPCESGVADRPSPKKCLKCGKDMAETQVRCIYCDEYVPADRPGAQDEREPNTYADAVDSLHKWEVETGSKASFSEANAYTDGFAAGRASVVQPSLQQSLANLADFYDSESMRDALHSGKEVAKRLRGVQPSPLVIGEPCPTCHLKYLGEMGDGDYSCVQCGMGMKEPCEHWKATLAQTSDEPVQPSPVSEPKSLWGWPIEEIKSAMRQFQGKHPGKLPLEIERASQTADAGKERKDG